MLGDKIHFTKTSSQRNSFNHLGVTAEKSLDSSHLCIFMDDGSSQAILDIGGVGCGLSLQVDASLVLNL